MNKKIIFLGAPGAGKGTQAEHAAATFGIPTISTGNIIREAVKAETAAGLAAKKFMDEGALVPDEVVIGIIKERLECGDCECGFILDGFPRTVTQAEALAAMGVDIDVAVSLEVADETIAERMTGRRVCCECGASYHILYKPSSDNIRCDKCGGNLIRRKDDDPEIVQSRLTVYHQLTEPLKDYYNERGKLEIVYGCEEVGDTIKATIEVFNKVFCEN
jgi:adenylate kinase